MGEMRNIYKILFGNPKGRDTLQDVGVDEGMLKWILMHTVKRCG